MATDHEVILGNGAILLRPFSPDDAEAIYDAVMASRKELGRWLSWCHADYTIQETAEFLATRGDAFQQEGEHGFAILERSSGQFVGATGINQLDRAALRANLGYWLRTSATGRGIATQAVRLVARWALEEHGLERIEIVAAVGNEASQRVARRAGARFEVVARRRLRVHGVQHDAAVFSLVRDDLRVDGP